MYYWIFKDVLLIYIMNKSILISGFLLMMGISFAQYANS